MFDSRGEAIGVATNNVAEYRALVEGLEAAARAGIDELEVVSDSELLVKQMRGEYKVKNAALRELSLEAARIGRRIGAVRYRVRPPRAQHSRRPARQRSARQLALNPRRARRQSEAPPGPRQPLCRSSPGAIPRSAAESCGPTCRQPSPRGGFAAVPRSSFARPRGARRAAAILRPARGCSSVGRASACHAEGRGFEPHHPLLKPP